MKDYKRLTFKRSENTSSAGHDELLNRLAELEDKTENGTLIELPCKCIEELDIIKDGMIFIFYKMCLEQNLGQGIFLEYKSKIDEWFKSYSKTEDYRRVVNEKYKILLK